jgi:hypothetical protein
MYNIKLMENFEESKLILEENLYLCREENNFLKERLKNYDDYNNSEEEKLKIFENEILKIRELLSEKTSEFIKCEKINKKNFEELQKNYNQIKNNLNEIKEENNKYSNSIKNISGLLTQNNFKEINDIIKDLMNENINNKNNNNPNNPNTNIYNNNNFTIILESQNQNKLNAINNYEDMENPNTQLYNNNLFEEKSDQSILLNNYNDKNTTFANKVIEEFDKVFNNQFKRLQNHYKKPEELKITRRQSYVKRSSGVRNYIIFNEKSPNQKFIEGLRSSERSKDNYENRSRDSISANGKASRTSSFINKDSSLFFDNFSKNNNINNSNIKSSINLNASNSNLTGDIDSMVSIAKDRVRSSINISSSIQGNDLFKKDNYYKNEISNSANRIKIIGQSFSPMRNFDDNSIITNKSSEFKISKGKIDNSPFKESNNNNDNCYNFNYSPKKKAGNFYNNSPGKIKSTKK